jgi:hypothetical protein
MRQRIASIVDPEAFAAGAGPDLADRRAIALDKADQIIALEFTFEELPAELREAAAVLDELGLGEEATRQ